jgi:cyclin B
MELQPDLAPAIRAVLVDWMVSAHARFNLLPETLYIAVGLVDRYLSRKTVIRQQLQLVGVSAMLIAAKYEEIYPPEVKDFVYVTDRAYTKDQILKMEADILTTLDFAVTWPTAWRFLERYAKVGGLDGMEMALA